MNHIDLHSSQLLKIFGEIKPTLESNQTMCCITLCTGSSNRIRENVTASFILLVALDATNEFKSDIDLTAVWKDESITTIEISTFISHTIIVIAKDLLKSALNNEEEYNYAERKRKGLVK